MSFKLNETQISIIESAKNISEKFDDDYWLDSDINAKFPHEFYDEVTSGGWLGISMPEKFGGSNLCKPYQKVVEEWQLHHLFI